MTHPYDNIRVQAPFLLFAFTLKRINQQFRD